MDLNELTKHYWSIGSGICHFVLVNDKFHYVNIGNKKLFALLGIEKRNEQDLVYNYIVRENNIPLIYEIVYLADHNINETTYSISKKRCSVTVHVPPLPVYEQDNEFIENYLTETFGQYKDTIKQYMSVFYYTNFRRLPTLILIGERGSGKSTFVEMMAEFYPSLSFPISQIDSQFNDFVEKKFIYIDESSRGSESQYEKLKLYSGQDYLNVNKKYTAPYKTRNNMNIVISSNSSNPIFVRPDEIPESEDNNQFLVLRIKRNHKGYDSSFKQKLVSRLGYYARTELKEIFESIKEDLNRFRYSIPVPITEEEKSLFAVYEPTLEEVTKKVINVLIQKIEDPEWEYAEFAQNGYIPSNFFKDLDLIPGNYKTEVIKNLQIQGYLTHDKAEKHKMVKGHRPIQYVLGKKLTSRSTIKENESDTEITNAA